MKFWYHLNKPESKRRNKTTWTIHFNKKCKLVSAVICEVPTYTTGDVQRQPYGKVKGEASSIRIKGGVATIR